MGIDEQFEGHVAIIAFDDLCLGLQGADDVVDSLQILFGDLRGLVEQDHVAELHLLDDQILDIVFVKILACERLTALELVLHAKGIDDGSDAVEDRDTTLERLFGHHVWNGTNGLCDGAWFADTRCFDNNIVETILVDQIVQLLDEVHLQGATDATVLQSYERVVVLTDDTTLLNEICIDIHFADIVDDNRKTNALLIGQDAIEKGCLTTAQITGEQKDRNLLEFHNRL